MGFLSGESTGRSRVRRSMEFVLTLVPALISVGYLPHAVAASYATQAGEARDLMLEEGCLAHLNTRTRLEYLSDGESRRVVLHEGEAFFEITADPAHPLRIELAGSKILAPGARFNVYRKSNGDVIVTVLDGLVRIEALKSTQDRVIWHRELRANQQVMYRSKALIQDISTVDASSTVKWREGVLEIADKPLPQVLDELRRYTDERIVIRDWRLKEIKVGGIMNIRDVPGALVQLEKLAPIALTKRGDTYVLKYRPPSQ